MQRIEESSCSLEFFYNFYSHTLSVFTCSSTTMNCDIVTISLGPYVHPTGLSELYCEEIQQQQQNLGALIAEEVLSDEDNEADASSHEDSYVPDLQFVQSHYRSCRPNRTWESHMRGLPDEPIMFETVNAWILRNISFSSQREDTITIEEMWLRFCYTKNLQCSRAYFGQQLSRSAEKMFRFWQVEKQCECGEDWSHVHNIAWRLDCDRTPALEKMRAEMLVKLARRRWNSIKAL